MNLKQVIEQTPELKALDSDYAAIAEWLNHVPMIDNPESQPTVPVSLDIDALRSAMSRAEKAGLLKLPPMAEYLADSYADSNVTESAIDSVAGYFDNNVTGTMPFLSAVRQLVDKNQREVLASLVTIMVQRNHLSAETATRISQEMAKTQPDPNWQAKIQGEPRYASLDLAGRVTPEQIQEALN